MLVVFERLLAAGIIRTGTYYHHTQTLTDALKHTHTRAHGLTHSRTIHSLSDTHMQLHLLSDMHIVPSFLSHDKGQSHRSNKYAVMRLI